MSITTEDLLCQSLEQFIIGHKDIDLTDPDLDRIDLENEIFRVIEDYSFSKYEMLYVVHLIYGRSLKEMTPEEFQENVSNYIKYDLCALLADHILKK